MSGQYCEGCGEGNLLGNPGGPGRRPVVCDLCGWTADAAELASKWMEDEAPWTKRERKAAGRLHFLWIDLDPEEPEVTSRLLRILGLDGMRVAPRVLFELETRPSDETLGRLRAVKGVRGVLLVP